MKKILFDLFPLIAFFVAYMVMRYATDDSHTGIMYGTSAAIIASAAQVGYLKLRGQPIKKVYWITLALLVVMGGLTLLLDDERFIKWKPTLLDWAFAAVFLGSEWFTAKNVMRRMLEETVALPAVIWTRLNMAWAIFFIVSGFLNLYVAFNFETDTWVTFRTLGLTGLTFAFALATAYLLARHVKDPDDTGGEPP